MEVLSGLSLEEIENITNAFGASKYRAKQIHNWIYTKSVSSFDEMTDLGKDFRQTLKDNFLITDTKVVSKQVSSDGTIKYLIEYPDGERVETVLMRFDNRANLTACVSSQIGCAVNCSFCATGKQGFKRNLNYKEIIEQVLTIQRDTKLKVTKHRCKKNNYLNKRHYPANKSSCRIKPAINTGNFAARTKPFHKM